MEAGADQACHGRLPPSGASLYRVADTPRYRTAHAKNVAHLLATGDFLVNLDADNTLTDGYVAWLTETLGAGPSAMAFSEAWGGGGGRIGLPRAVFSALGGYDERFEGWGYEDGDLLERARGFGLKAVKAPGDLVEFISHDDSLRGSDKESTRSDAMRLSEADRATAVRGQRGPRSGRNSGSFMKSSTSPILEPGVLPRL